MIGFSILFNNLTTCQLLPIHHPTTYQLVTTLFPLSPNLEVVAPWNRFPPEFRSLRQRFCRGLDACSTLSQSNRGPSLETTTLHHHLSRPWLINSQGFNSHLLSATELVDTAFACNGAETESHSVQMSCAALRWPSSVSTIERLVWNSSFEVSLIPTMYRSRSSCSNSFDYLSSYTPGNSFRCTLSDLEFEPRLFTLTLNMLAFLRMRPRPHLSL